MKATSIRKPQSSSPFKSARQKVFGLGYSLLVFAYQKTDDDIREILEREGNADDLIAFMRDRNLPLDDVAATQLAEEILQQPPELGYLTISNALQWRLQYRRVIEKAGMLDGIVRVS